MIRPIWEEKDQMKRRFIIILFLTMLLLGGIVTAGQAGVAQVFGAGEIHRRYGAFIEGSLDGSNLTGRPQTSSAVIQTGAGFGESYYVFPVLSTFEGVHSASFHLLNRTGVYSGKIWLSLDVYGIDGSYKRTIGTALDLTTIPTGTWQTLNLSGNNSVSPAEILVAHFVYSDGAGGTMDIRPIFDVKTYSGFRAYLTLIRR